MRARTTARAWVLAAVAAAVVAPAVEAKGPGVLKPVSKEIYHNPCFGYYPTTWREFPAECQVRTVGLPGGHGAGFAEERTVIETPYGPAAVPPASRPEIVPPPMPPVPQPKGGEKLPPPMEVKPKVQAPPTIVPAPRLVVPAALASGSSARATVPAAPAPQSPAAVVPATPVKRQPTSPYHTQPR